MPLRAIIFSVLFLLFAWKCSQNYPPQPKQRSYFRIDLPPHSFDFDTAPCNFIFRKNSLAKIGLRKEKCWFNIEYPFINCKIHLTIYPIGNDKELASLIEESKKLVYKHAAKVSAIEENYITDTLVKKKGIKFYIKGESASFIQFFFIYEKNFFRGAVYFETSPNYDSLLPLINYINLDVDTFIYSLRLLRSRD